MLHSLFMLSTLFFYKKHTPKKKSSCGACYFQYFWEKYQKRCCWVFRKRSSWSLPKFKYTHFLRMSGGCLENLCLNISLFICECPRSCVVSRHMIWPSPPLCVYGRIRMMVAYQLRWELFTWINSESSMNTFISKVVEKSKPISWIREFYNGL